MIIQFVLMIILYLTVTRFISTRVTENAMKNLGAITDQRAQIVMDHVDNAESLLSSFSKSPEVMALLRDPSDADALKAGKEYTTAFAEDIKGLDGLYITDIKTRVLAQNENKALGKQCFTGDALVKFDNELSKAEKNIYTVGICESVSSGKQVITLFKTVFDTNGRAIGIVGMNLDTGVINSKLESIKTPGLEHSFYSMIDVQQRVYVFDEDMSNAGQPVVLPDLVQQCDIYENATEAESTTYVFDLPTGSYAGASNFMPDRHWLLMMNDEKKEVYSLAYTMRTFFITFCWIMIAMMVLFGFLNRKQQKVNRKLLASVEAVNETKKSLNTAMFGDILTNANNRVKLATDLSGITDGKTNPYYFAMFNIMEFSNINTAYGSDTGDSLLVRVTDTLKAAFPKGEVYRTGSDEFVVMIKSIGGLISTSDVLFGVDEALKQLLVPVNVNGLGQLFPKYKVAVIRKTSDIDASVITILKEMTNVKGEAMCGMIDFSDLSE